MSFRSLRRIATGPIAAVAVTLLAGCGGGGAHQVSITVADARQHVAAQTTLAALIAREQLHPPAGNLLDVHGSILRRGVYPGTVLVDGRARSGGYRLQNGDHVELARGHDRHERRERLATPTRRGALADPLFVLSRTPGVYVVVRGAVSHEVVAVKFHPAAGQPRIERAVALTFDDGPWPSTTERILRVLHRLHAPATFFDIGYLAQHSPQLVALEKRDGMTIGNHTYNHPEVPPFGQLPPKLVRDEIALGAARLSSLGVRAALFRPPAGSYSATTVRIAHALGERVVLWSVDPADWQPGVTAHEIASRVLGAVRAGSIVELHDGGGVRDATVRALPAIIKGIRRKHLRLVAIPER